jgi:PAS domain S-box-containing protein
MDASMFIFSFLGSANLALACALAYYVLKNSRVLEGANAEYSIMTATLLYAIMGAFFPFQSFVLGSLPVTRYFLYTVFIFATVFLASGSIYSGLVVRRATGKISWLEIMRRFPYGIYRVVGIGILALLVFPVWTISLMVETSPGIFFVLASSFVLLAFATFLLGERRLYLNTKPSAVAAGAVDDELLREDIRAFRACSDLTNRFSAAVALVTGIEFLREILSQVTEKHKILNGIELSDNGFLKSKNVAERLVLMDEKKSIPKIYAAFSDLNSRLINFYGAATSSKVASKTFENIYLTVKEAHESLATFPEVVKGLPSGVLEDEKIAFARREELEQKVRERTATLEKTITELERMDVRLRESEARLRGVVGLLPETVFEADKNGKIAFINLAGYDAFGYSPQDVDEGLDLLQLLAPEDRDRVKERIAQVLDEQKLVSDECTALRKDGETYPVLIRISPIVYADKPVGMRGVFLNIADRKQVEAVQHKSVINILETLQRARKVEKVAPADERIRKIQMSAIGTIKKQLRDARPSPIVEAYKDLLARPIEETRIRKRRKRPRKKSGK